MVHCSHFYLRSSDSENFFQGEKTGHKNLEVWHISQNKWSYLEQFRKFKPNSALENDTDFGSKQLRGRWHHPEINKLNCWQVTLPKRPRNQVENRAFLMSEELSKPVLKNYFLQGGPDLIEPSKGAIYCSKTLSKVVKQSIGN